MITCREAHHLFDAFVDGELSPAMRAEMHAHRLKCRDCSHELAILEACADVIRTDRREPVASADFTDRLLARLAPREAVPAYRWRRIAAFVGAPMAAAAVLVFAFAALFEQTAPTPVVSGPPPVAAWSGRMPDSILKDNPKVQSMMEGPRNTLYGVQPVSTDSVLRLLVAPAFDGTRTGISRTRKSFAQIYEFLTHGCTSPAVVVPADDAVTAATPAPRVEDPMEDGGWFDTVNPSDEHPVKPAVKEVPELGEIM